MKFTFIKTLFLIFSIQLFSQNLVLNPSFENTKSCVNYIGRFNKNVTGWSTPTFGTTDLFNSCTKGNTGIPDNFNGKQYVKFGKNYSGFYLHSDNNYREYIQVKLTQKLKKGTKYTISFYISLAEKSDFAIRNIDFLLTENKLNTTLSRELSEKQLKKLNIKNHSLYKINNYKFYDNKSGWTLISKEFIAKGYEGYLTIGNFNKNSKTDKTLVSNKNRFDISYYYIDLVSIEKTNLIPINQNKEVEIIEQPIQKNEIPKIELNKNYTFENIVFDFKSIELSEIAKMEIKSVYKFLMRNDDTNIIISGYTDNIGISDFNQKLSEKRANSVTNFFISIGLNKNRITTIGYGNKKPISTNETEKGRKKNRRVEFKIIDK